MACVLATRMSVSGSDHERSDAHFVFDVVGVVLRLVAASRVSRERKAWERRTDGRS
jgi:hypothetical protein